MVEFNTRGGETIWWQTFLHVVLFFFLIIILIAIIGFAWMFLGSFEGIFSFVMRGFQFGLATFFALSLPTFILKKSNELVACVIAATIFILVSVLLFLNTEFLIGPKHSFFEWLEMFGTLAGVLGASIAYYFGDR